MNEGGYSWSEAILTLTIVMVIFGSLLPLATTMTSKLQMKKMQMYAAETALQGAIYFKAHGLTAGYRQVDEVDYHWSIEGQAVCVSYHMVEQPIRKCVYS
ncbi:hypothetical protein [Sporosarcina beigongshangi]|uniref:hypothetical protein n=1 Tax=Sporosarcina beigongshangi TaxID=2782538 RepID=UPI001939ABB2|nr:hypothetical protein [Sporosarcina beigongshangi]